MRPYDRCVLTLPDEKADDMTPTDGHMVIEVGDVAGPRWRSCSDLRKTSMLRSAVVLGADGLETETT